MAISTQIETRDGTERGLHAPATERGASPEPRAQAGCCGGAAPQGSDACCVRDAEVKSKGGAGCGCGSRAASAAAEKKGCC